MDSSVLAYLGFASKAGKLAFGQAKTAACIKAGRAKAVLIAGDISQKSRKEMLFLCEKYSVAAFVTEDNSDTFLKATGRMCSVISICDNSFADAVKSKLKLLGGNADDS